MQRLSKRLNAHTSSPDLHSILIIYRHRLVVCVCGLVTIRATFRFMQDTFLRRIQVLDYTVSKLSARLVLSFSGMCMYNTELSLTNIAFCEVIKGFTVIDEVWGINTQILLARE